MIAIQELYDAVTAHAPAHADAIETLRGAEAAREAAETTLRDKRAAILLQHDTPELVKALGTNEAQRKAAVDSLCCGEIADLRDAEYAVREAQAALDTLRVQDTLLGRQLRLAELAAMFAQK